MQARRVLRHEHILDVALRIFSQRGYFDTAIDTIAAEANTSKGGVYFHFPSKQAIFGALLDRMAGLLRSRVEEAIAAEANPIRRADVALQVLLETFGSHRMLARLFLVESLGAGHEFQERFILARSSFAGLIKRHLDEAVETGVIAPQDTAMASRVWLGALNEIVTDWVLSNDPGNLEDCYPAVRATLLASIGVSSTTQKDKDDVGPVTVRA